jgi:hypothetical protein
MAKSKQSQDAQELNNLLKDVLKTQKQINEERIKDLDITRSINDEVTEGLKALSKEKDFKSAIRRSLKEINKLSEQNFDLSELDLKLASNKEDISKRQNALSKSQISLLREQTYVNQKINTLLSEKVGATKKEKKAIDDQIESFKRVQKGLTEAIISSDQYNKNLKSAAAGVDKLNKLIVPNAFKGLSEIAKDIPGLRKLSGPFEAMASASKDTAARMTKINMQRQATGNKAPFSQAQIGLKSLTSGFSALGPIIKKALGPLALISMAVEAIQFFVDAMFAADERVTKLAKGLMISKDASSAIYTSFTKSKFEIDSIYNTTKDVTEAFTDLTELTEFATTSTMGMVEAQIILTKNLGLSKEQAFGVQEAFAANNIEANNGVDIVYDQIAAFANQNKIVSSGKAIFNDIAKTSKLIQVNFKGNLGSLVKTTLEAKKLGLSLEQVTKVGSSLLNFEESISSELEAELLTGRDINLEKARLYALNHDIAGLTQEITNQGITQESFANMNVIQQEAIAKSLGMSAEEMGEMLYKASVLEKVGGQDLKNKRKMADELERQGKITEAINLRNEIAQLEQGVLSGKSLEEAEKSASAQEKFNQALEQAKELFSDLVTGGYLDALADAIKTFTNYLNSGQTAANEAAKLEKEKEEALKKGENEQAKELDKQIQEKKDESEDSAEITGEVKGAGIGAGIGATLGLLTGIGAGLLSGGAGFAAIPSLMAAGASAGAGAGGILGYATAEAPQPTSMDVKDFVIRTLPEDTVVGMGGTALGRTDEMVKLLTQQNQHLDKQNTLLASIYNKEGTIVLNGTKMGTAMNVGGYKTA